MVQKRASLFREIWKNKAVRYGGVPLGALSFWDVLSNQFDIPKIPQFWHMTAAVLPLWAWLFLMLCLFTYGLFEYVRLNVQPISQETPSQGEEEEEALADKASSMAAKIRNFHNAGLPKSGLDEGALIIQCISLMKTFDKAGYPTFSDEDMACEPKEAFGLWAGYFTIASQFLRDGHEDEARVRLNQISVEVKEDAANAKASQ